MSSPSSSPPRRFTGRTKASEILKDVDLSGRTFAITGTTNGIGKETARVLVMANAHVVMLVRNISAGQAIADKWRKTKADIKVDVIECDLLLLKSVTMAADTFLAAALYNNERRPV